MSSSPDEIDETLPRYEVEIAGSTDGGDRVPELSPREAVERYLSKRRVEKRESTVSTYHYRLKPFVEWCEDEDIETTSELSGWDIDEYETFRRGTGLELVSLSNELKTLKQFFRFCARIEIVDEGLPDKVDLPDVDASDQVSKERLHTDDARTLLGYYADDEYGSRAHALLALAWYTGARLGALRALDLTDYDHDEEYVEFVHRPREGTPLKNGRDGERIVGLPESVCNVVDAYLTNQRHDVYDSYGRQPLLSSEVGRASTICDSRVDVPGDSPVPSFALPARK